MNQREVFVFLCANRIYFMGNNFVAVCEMTDCAFQISEQVYGT